GQESDWNAFLNAIRPAFEQQRAAQGAGLRFLTGPVTSPTFVAQMNDLLAQLPQARWYQYSPTGGDNSRAGLRQAFGENVEVIYRLDQANVIVALDSDFMMDPATGTRYQRDWAQRRRVRRGQTQMNRLYAVEPTLTNTGNMADHRLRARAGQIEQIARALATAVGVAGAAPTAQLT